MATKKVTAKAAKAANVPVVKRETLSERVVSRLMASGMAKAEAEKMASIVAVRTRRTSRNTPLAMTDKGAVLPVDLLKLAFASCGAGSPVAHVVNARKREPRIIVLWAPKL